MILLNFFVAFLSHFVLFLYNLMINSFLRVFSQNQESKGFIYSFVSILIFLITTVAIKIVLGLNNRLSVEFIIFRRLYLESNLAYF
jgi:hypothetical protein